MLFVPRCWLPQGADPGIFILIFTPGCRSWGCWLSQGCSLFQGVVYSGVFIPGCCLSPRLLFIPRAVVYPRCWSQGCLSQDCCLSQLSQVLIPGLSNPGLLSIPGLSIPAVPVLTPLFLPAGWSWRTLAGRSCRTLAGRSCQGAKLWLPQAVTSPRPSPSTTTLTPCVWGPRPGLCCPRGPTPWRWCQSTSVRAGGCWGHWFL